MTAKLAVMMNLTIEVESVVDIHFSIIQSETAAEQDYAV